MAATAIYQLKTEGISSEDFGGELVAVNFTNGKYYGLSGAAPLIWRLLNQPRSIDDLTNEVCRRTGADRLQVDAGIAAFLQRLQDEDLVSVVTGTGSSGPVPIEPGPADRRWSEVPELTVYSDLQELILLDPVHDADPDHGWPVRREDHINRK